MDVPEEMIVALAEEFNSTLSQQAQCALEGKEYPDPLWYYAEIANTARHGWMQARINQIVTSNITPHAKEMHDAPSTDSAG